MNYTQTGIIVSSDPITEFSIQLIATLIGAGVGFALAMWWDRRTKSVGIKLIKINMIKSIIEELKHVQKEIKQQKYGIELKYDEVIVDITIVPTNAFASAVNSGNFSLLSSDVQIQLSHLYTVIDQYNVLTSQLLHVFRTTGMGNFDKVKDALHDMSRDLKADTSILIKEINQILPVLESIDDSLN